MRFQKLTGGFLLSILLTVPVGAAEPSKAWKEIIRPNEAEEFAKAAKTIQQLQDEHARRHEAPKTRGFHAKNHSAVRAELRVIDGLPDAARQGIFSKAKTYPCWVRFSNGVGFVQGDRKPDVRGLAIKVIGAKGPKLLEAERDAVTQDFLMTNNPTSLARDGTQFLAFAETSVNQLTFPVKLAAKVGAKEAARILAFLARNVIIPPKSMATETFWSGAPIKFGPYAVKFLARPVGADNAPSMRLGTTDYLRRELKERLKLGDIRYDFFVQFYVDEKRTPIEDSSIEWLEEVARPVKVAELTIRKRDLDEPAAKDEDKIGNSFGYTPWHATEDLRPLGHIQRIRKAVYAASAQHRGNAPEPRETEKSE